jgi:hypothetical protein
LLFFAAILPNGTHRVVHKVKNAKFTNRWENQLFKFDEVVQAIAIVWLIEKGCFCFVLSCLFHCFKLLFIVLFFVVCVSGDGLQVGHWHLEGIVLNQQLQPVENPIGILFIVVVVVFAIFSNFVVFSASRFALLSRLRILTEETTPTQDNNNNNNNNYNNNSNNNNNNITTDITNINNQIPNNINNNNNNNNNNIQRDTSILVALLIALISFVLMRK